MLASGGLTRNKNNLSPTRRRVGGVGHHHSTGRYVTLKWYVESAQGSWRSPPLGVRTALSHSGRANASKLSAEIRGRIGTKHGEGRE
jgi:hypothetical protein